MYDIESENKQLNITELENIHLLKTGALIEASVCTGAILCGSTRDQLTQLKMYARHIGLAFQVADDVLNIEGDPKIMGKAAGTDIERNKSTYPAILGLEKSKQLAADMVKKALQAIELFDNKSDPLRAISCPSRRIGWPYLVEFFCRRNRLCYW